jgi:ABC-type branched-subunit amino acid transport system substrate-binding protein
VPAAARTLTAAGAVAVIGGAGPGVGEALRDVAESGSLLFLNVTAAEERLRNERCDRHAFHVAPSVTMLVDSLGQWLAGRGRRRGALLADGGSGEVEAAARRAAGRFGAVVVSSDDAADVRWLALDEAALPPALARARRTGELVAGVGGSVVSRLGPDEAVGVWAVAWHHELERFSARELNRRFRRRFGMPLDDVGWAAWAAVKLVGEGLVRAQATSPPALLAFLESAPPFDGHKGTALTFRSWDHQLRQPLYVVAPRKRDEIGGARGAFHVVGETPAAGADALGTGVAESRCRQERR